MNHLCFVGAIALTSGRGRSMAGDILNVRFRSSRMTALGTNQTIDAAGDVCACFGVGPVPSKQHALRPSGPRSPTSEGFTRWMFVRRWPKLVRASRTPTEISRAFGLTCSNLNREFRLPIGLVCSRYLVGAGWPWRSGLGPYGRHADAIPSSRWRV